MRGSGRCGIKEIMVWNCLRFNASFELNVFWLWLQLWNSQCSHSSSAVNVWKVHKWFARWTTWPGDRPTYLEQVDPHPLFGHLLVFPHPTHSKMLLWQCIGEQEPNGKTAMFAPAPIHGDASARGCWFSVAVSTFLSSPQSGCVRSWRWTGRFRELRSGVRRLVSISSRVFLFRRLRLQVVGVRRLVSLRISRLSALLTICWLSLSLSYTFPFALILFCPTEAQREARGGLLVYRSLRSNFPELL
jgi:hypothetical protein